MKKSIIVALSLLSLVACKSNEDKAKALVEKHLSETLHDYDSYQSVKWGALDSAFNSSASTKERRNAILNFCFYVDRYRDVKDEEGEFYAKLRDEYRDSADFYKRIVDSLEKVFVPQHVGWTIEHTYRAKNLNGAYRLTTDKYAFNLKLDSIYTIPDKEEEEE